MIHKTYLALSLLVTLTLIPLLAHAEDYDEEEDLEAFFSIRSKSTLHDFPLQEIGSEELSNAAIAGALRATTAKGAEAKPIYLEEKEQLDKEKSGLAEKKNKELELETELETINNTLNFGQTQSPGSLFQQDVYTMPSGRIYSGHHTTTVERP